VTETADEPSRARTLHALSGLLPVGVFLIVHLLTNAQALAGQGAFDRAMAFWDGVPLHAFVEIALVMLPLSFHAGYGVVLMLRPRALVDSPYPDNWRVLVRAAAWVAFAFIAYHAYALGVPRWTHAVGTLGVHTLLTAHLSNATGSAAGVLMPWTALFYLVGLAATTLHFSAGTWGYFVRTKRVTTPSAKRRLAIAAGLVGVLLFTVSSATVISLATGSPLMAPAPEPPPCPAPPLAASAAH
jgi:succinate dehydrogenase / fumarate reductase cytochrome b subunit